ncbi:N-acyl-phosphatidylethanolamine-hydrolyzing phospholipase D, mitochondrial [Madurella mycetomatis]|uniref:N-acyl-phosphatidylethanolamine-hydrolyzing phospholipase D, mitochondrial n=1 Tax=Madurella mycetomatis TaxID=100816 RepID=A0A175VY10_9PEZI|nr:N-acyl-phosphatidylethanolamine-hydrolyzing phospholipase D, mitochondrial [Madurella mycetomatis]
MAPIVRFDTPLSITHIGTATAIIHLDGLNLITDPVFSPAGTTWDIGILTLEIKDTPAFKLADLPHIDAVLLSHEDHPDNLDEPGRVLLDGRHVFTTPDGAKQLAPRPDVRAMKDWETITLEIGSRRLEITGTPCQHLPGGEVTGFILTNPSFGKTDGKPNAIYFSGDTIYLPELAKMKEKYHISVAMLNIGKATAPLPTGDLVITMDGVNAARLFKEIGADLLVPMHFESWGHFAEKREDLEKALEKEGVMDKVLWLEPGVRTNVVQRH